MLARQRIIGLLSTLPSQLSGEELQKFNLPRLSADDLEKLTSQKLATIAAKLITMDSLHGPDPDLPIDALLAELDQTAEKQYVRSSIRKADADRQNQVDAETLNAGLRMDYVMHNRSAGAVDDQVPTDETSALITFAQSSATAIASTKHPRDAPPLRMVETEASKQ